MLPSKTDRHLTSGMEWAYRDLLLTLFVAAFALAVLAMVQKTKPKHDSENTGTLVVVLHWAIPADADVDLWVEGPGDVPVGYMRRTGKIFDLLHDDRGTSIEHSVVNTEFAVARSLPEGLYIVNAVLYASWDHKFPVLLDTHIYRASEAGQTELYSGTGQLNEVKQEITLVTFRIDANHALLPGSVIANPPTIPLYAAR